MLTERAELLVRAGEEEAFAAMVAADVKPLLLGVPGILSVRLGRGVENPQKFIMLNEWSELAAHDAFNGSAAQTLLRSLLSTFTIYGAMEHFVIEP